MASFPLEIPQVLLLVYHESVRETEEQRINVVNVSKR